MKAFKTSNFYFNTTIWNAQDGKEIIMEICGWRIDEEELITYKRKENWVRKFLHAA